MADDATYRNTAACGIRRHTGAAEARLRIIGVDPGSYGAIALLVDGRLETVVDMPFFLLQSGKTDKAEVDGYTLAEILREMRGDIGFVEKVGGMEGQAAGAAFNFGRAAGAPEYIMKALGVRVERVSPVVWKRALKIRGGKDASREAAMRHWPTLSALFKRKIDEDRAEAALIAEWGRIHSNINGEQNERSHPDAAGRGSGSLLREHQTGIFE